MKDLHQLELVSLSRLLRARDLTASDLLDALIARAGEVPNVYVTPLFDQAREAAREADREFSGGAWRGPLHGIPLAVKDAIAVEGVATTACSRLIAPQRAKSDATVVERLRRAGAIPIGTVHCAELCIGAPDAGDAFPWPGNPHDPNRSPGGSSSGSAVGLATGLFPAALGSDTAGSIRLPAGFCGVAGLKPTDGLVPTTGLVPLSPSLDQIGPMARTSRDCAVILDALLGGTGRGAGPADRLDGIRLGIDPKINEMAAPEWRDACAAAVALFGQLGADVQKIALPALRDYSKCALAIMLGEAYVAFGADIASHPEKVSRATAMRLAAGAPMALELQEARLTRKTLATRTLDAMSEVDAVLLPLAQGDPPCLEAIRPLDYMQAPMFTTPANIAGLPAVSVRSGRSCAGLPLALQIMGRPGGDVDVLRIAEAYERATPEWRVIPD